MLVCPWGMRSDVKIIGTEYRILLEASPWVEYRLFPCFPFILYFLFLKIIYLFIFREKGKEGQRKGEKHQSVVASHMPPTGDLSGNPGLCPDWESVQGLWITGQCSIH